LQPEITDDLWDSLSLGSYYRYTSFRVQDRADLFTPSMPKCDAIIGCEFFDDTSGNPGVRLLLDFKSKRLLPDACPSRPRVEPPPGTIALPMHKDTVRGWSISVLVNGEPVDFILSTADDSVFIPLLPTVFDTSKGIKGTKQMVPITLQLGAQSVKVTATFEPDLGNPILGLSLLSRYRVVIDYRDKILYLEPPTP